LQNQNWKPFEYNKNARFVSNLGMPVIELLSPKPGEKILDLGCGDGFLAAELVKMGCKVTGVDSSQEMVLAAKSLGLDVYLKDAQKLNFYDEFDAVFSNAALHWMKNQKQVVNGVWNALKRKGRFVGELGGAGNIATVIKAIEEILLLWDVQIPNPWFFPTTEEYKELLESGGFLVKSIELIPRPTKLTGDIGEWLEIFAQSYFSFLAPSKKKLFISKVVKILKPVLYDENKQWTIDYVRLRFYAIKENINI